MSSATATATVGDSAMFEARPDEIARVPSARQLFVDRLFRHTCPGFASLRVSPLPAVQRYGLGFVTGRVWEPNTERYGILAEIWGTLYTSILALGLGTAF